MMMVMILLIALVADVSIKPYTAMYLNIATSLSIFIQVTVGVTSSMVSGHNLLNDDSMFVWVSFMHGLTLYFSPLVLFSLCGIGLMSKYLITIYLKEEKVKKCACISIHVSSY